MNLTSAALSEALADVCGGRLVASVRRLSGGYSWITLLVRFASGGSEPVIVRVAPLAGTVEPYDPDAEALRLRAVAGLVPAPEVLGVVRLPNPVGRPFGVHSYVAGELLRRPSNPAPYLGRLAETLGVLHARADASLLSPVSDIGSAYSLEIERIAAAYRRCWRHPGIDAALRWLAQHRPECALSPVFCHGDYRPANVLWGASGELLGVLDWERAWAGDPLCDVAFTMHFGGWASLEGEAWDIYARCGGAADEHRLAYALRLERVRAYIAAMSGLVALTSGRSDDVRLLRIGASAQVGAWELVRWLESDMPPLSEVLPNPPEGRCPLHASPLAQGNSDRGDSSSGGQGLRLSLNFARLPGWPKLLPPEWEAEYESLLERVGDCGRELVAPLLELGSRDPVAGEGVPSFCWRE